MTDYEISAKRRDGEIRNWHVSAEMVRDPRTDAPAVWVVINDVTDVIRAFEAVEVKNRQLEHSNQELTQFASVAAHDLQEPLRKVRAFGDRLASTQGERLDEKGRDYLSRMQNAAARMQTLIDDLLSMSRVTTKAQPFEIVDLNEVAREVVIDLSERIEEEGATIKIGDLPVVKAEPTQMRQLFQNLIGNSLKYRRDDLAPLVRVWSTDDAWDRWTVNFEDNGIGFSDESAEKIFEVFERLVGRSEYPGNGVGLAICRKIVDRHGGEIKAVGRPGRGATFSVALPKERMAA